RATGGLQVSAPVGLEPLTQAGTIVLPGWRDLAEQPPAELLDALVAAYERGARLLSVCSGAFVLAATGLLDGRRATTHWRYADELARRYPAIEVDPSVLYVDEGSLLTSAGSAAGLDLCLHLVRRDFGAAVANSVARRLVVPPHRDGGQAQFIDAPIDASENGLAELLDWARQRLDQAHSTESLARQAHISPRTLARRFRDTMGSTPHQWLRRERVARAREYLEETDWDLERIAQRCGFGEAQLLRLHFSRLVGTTPSQYRKTFRREAQAP
ncbi:MAG: helix-turn-helix domain-containing protein, partial [Acidobacteriota bacterium]